MKRSVIFGMFAAIALTAGSLVTSCMFLPSSEKEFNPADEGYTLVWEDTFNTLDKDVWPRQTWAAGKVNHELQKYVDNDTYAKVSTASEGAETPKSLKIMAVNNGSWSSARLHYKNAKEGFKYGYFEARIKMPVGYKNTSGTGTETSNAGVWPAFWMMPVEAAANGDGVYGGWPRSGEIDIMEYSPSKSGESTYGTVHYGTDAGAGHKYTSLGKTTLDDPVHEWHTYGCLWTSGGIEMFYDGKSLGVFYANTCKSDDVNWKTYPYDQEFYPILNLAIGGDLGGTVNSEMKSAVMEVDYVRVYQK